MIHKPTSNLKRCQPSTIICQLFLLLLLSGSFASQAQTPKRKAFAGLRLKTENQQVIVDSIYPEGSFFKSGIKRGDALVKVNDVTVQQPADLQSAFIAIREGDPVSIRYIQKDKQRSEKLSGKARPFLTHPLADVVYDWVPFRDGYLRTVTYQPKNKTGVPAILLIPGYGCGSIENYLLSYNGKMISEWLQRDYAVVTIEKSGIGDSWGCAPCNEVDLATDIESFDAGYNYMKGLKFVDQQKLFIWGHSMGGTIAPEIAKKHNPAGVMVFGCVFRPWSEFLLEMHRVQKPLMEGMSYADTEAFTRTIQKVYHDFFINKKSPAELVKKSEYEAIVRSEFNFKEGSNNMWGRHWRFWQQLDSVNLAESWGMVNCPVLILHGGTDYEQCSQVEPYMIRETVNSKHPGAATLITIPDLDHFMMRSNSWKEAYQNFKDQGYAKGNFNRSIAETTIKWMKKVLK